MENKWLHVIDTKGALVVKAPTATNITFKVELKVMEHICLYTITNREEWICHYHLGHLNFRDLTDLQKNGMVAGLPSINILVGICKESLQAKKHKGKISKDADCRTKNHLEVVYSNVCGPIQVNSIGGNMYFITFIDDHSRKLWTYLIKRNDEVFEVLKKFKSMVERQSGHKLKLLKTDG